MVSPQINMLSMFKILGMGYSRWQILYQSGIQFSLWLIRETTPTFVHPQETSRLASEPVPGISALPDENNGRYFHVTVAGPEDVSLHVHVYTGSA